MGVNRHKDVYRGNDIHDELIKCFESSIPLHSVGQRMLYPTSFTVLLHPKDFEDVNEIFPFLVKEVALRLEENIEKRRKKKRYSNFEAPSKNWFFQFSVCERFSPTGQQEDEIVIQSHKPCILASLYSVAIGASNTREAGNLKMSLKPKNSETYAKFDINPNVFIGLDTLGTGTFRVKIKSDFQPITDAPVFANAEVYARIYFESLVYEMMDKEIIISRKNSQDDPKRNILQVNSPAVADCHARIRYDAATNSFALAAFQYVRLNEREVTLSSARDPVWFELSPDANILVGGKHAVPVSMQFISNK